MQDPLSNISVKLEYYKLQFTAVFLESVNEEVI